MMPKSDSAQQASTGDSLQPTDTAVPLRGTALGNLLRRLPRPIKRRLLSVFWTIKALKEDLQDYLSEMIGHVPCHAARLLLYRTVCGLRIGSFSSIHRRCRMHRPTLIWIGDHTVINYGVLLDGRRSLTIGNNVSISEGCVILTLGHDVDDPEFSLKGAPVTIGDRVFLGSYARILPGVAVGEGAVVGVGAVVTKDVAPYTVVAGVPARHIRDRSRSLSYNLNYRKRFG